MSKRNTYTRIGTATIKLDISAEELAEIPGTHKPGGTYVKVTTDNDREQAIGKYCSDLTFIDLPYRMDEYHSAQFALTMPGVFWSDGQKAALNQRVAREMRNHIASDND